MSQPLNAASTDGSYPSTAGYLSVEPGLYNLFMDGTFGSATVTWQAKRSVNWITIDTDAVFTAAGMKLLEIGPDLDVRATISGATTATAISGWMDRVGPNVN